MIDGELDKFYFLVEEGNQHHESNIDFEGNNVMWVFETAELKLRISSA